jgi:3-deoxy-manno-octulosonate cytidylyltransferase (CMP-KDO synthetase)
LREKHVTPLIIIPARMASTRLPGKPLADIDGKPMIVRVCELAARSGVGPVYVAAAETAIAEAVRAAGFQAVLTDPELPSGSDRVHAAAEQIDPQGRFDVLLNVQGDMPTLAPQAISACLQALSEETDLATLADLISEPKDRKKPNIVKVVMGIEPGHTRARAHYFTRAEAPAGEGPLYHHIGIYGWRRSALARFVASPPSVLERREKLEQLRALELGLRIDVALVTGHGAHGVDTHDDLERARAYLANRKGQTS